MPDSSQIDPSHYPNAELAGTPATAFTAEAPADSAPIAAAPAPAQASALTSLQVGRELPA